MNQTEKQRAFDYSMYVMLSSYFDKTVCTTKLQEKKLCLAYQELKEDAKQDYDESSIRIIEKELLPKLPKKFVQQRMNLALLGSADDTCTEIRLQNDNYVLRIKSRYSKRVPKMVYELLFRELSDTCCQIAKEHDSGVSRLFLRSKTINEPANRYCERGYE